MGEESQVKEFMHTIIEEICDQIGPRPPCSVQEHQAAEYFENRLKSYTDETAIENFTCHPGAYRAQFQIPFFGLLLATAFYAFYAFGEYLELLLITFGILLGSVLIIQTNIQRNIELIDPLFETKKSTNVYGKFYPKHKSQKRIVIGGHHDSNWEFPLLRKSWKLFGILVSAPIIFIYVFFGVVVLQLLNHLIFLNVFGFRVDLLWLDSTILLLSLVISGLHLIFGMLQDIISDRPVMGANDNLTSLAVMLALASHFKKNELLNTELWFVSHGCEEIGDRGSKRFSAKHFKELKDALVINIDMIGGKDTQLRFVTSEVVFLIKLSKEIVNELGRIAEELGIPYQKKRIDAFTDSMAYAQKDIQTCSIVGFPEHGVPPHYHTREDTIEKLEFKNLWDCYRICLEFINRVDLGMTL